MTENGVITTAEAAAWLKVDNQTIRLMLQQGLVNWGIAYRRTPRSRQYSYLIYLNKFSEETGYRKDIKSNE